MTKDHKEQYVVQPYAIYEATATTIWSIEAR